MHTNLEHEKSDLPGLPYRNRCHGNVKSLLGQFSRRKGILCTSDILRVVKILKIYITTFFFLLKKIYPCTGISNIRGIPRAPEGAWNRPNPLLTFRPLVLLLPSQTRYAHRETSQETPRNLSLDRHNIQDLLTLEHLAIWVILAVQT